jgi:hypothetical protein
MLGGMRKMKRRDLRTAALLTLCIAATTGGCGGHVSAIATVEESAIPSSTVWVFLATGLPCKNLGADHARFTPLVVRGPGYTTTIDPYDGCRKQRFVRWWSYGYSVPVPQSGRVRLTPGNQPTATLDAIELRSNQSATIYYVNCVDYYPHCGKGRHFQGRITSIEYFKDDDVSDVPN